MKQILILALLLAGCGAVRSADELSRTWRAVCAVESGGNTLAYNDSEKAVGIAQIRPIMVADVNRFSTVKYQHSDAWDPEKSYEIFRAYCLHYFPKGSSEQWARAWNGGPKGPGKSATLGYWRRVQFHMSR